VPRWFAQGGTATGGGGGGSGVVSGPPPPGAPTSAVKLGDMNRYLGHCFAALLSPMKRNGGEVQPFSHADLVTSVCPVRNPSALFGPSVLVEIGFDLEISRADSFNPCALLMRRLIKLRVLKV